MLRLAVRAFIFAALTILTQIGGLAYLTGLWIARWRDLGRWARMSCVVLTYVAFSTSAHFAAPLFGRTPLPCFGPESGQVEMHSLMYCALNRHFVTPRLKEAGDALATHMERDFPGTRTLALDANFPFFTGFPLLPHLSHDDGRKLDLAFFYQTQEGAPETGRTKSPIGYWAFEDGPSECEEPLLTLRWDMKWFEPFLNDLELDERRTAHALQWLANEGPRFGVNKVFVEPHLAKKLRVTGANIRFQGCRAARHDDHIHFQVSDR